MSRMEKYKTQKIDIREQANGNPETSKSTEMYIYLNWRRLPKRAQEVGKIC